MGVGGFGIGKGRGRGENLSFSNSPVNTFTISVGKSEYHYRNDGIQTTCELAGVLSLVIKRIMSGFGKQLNNNVLLTTSPSIVYLVQSERCVIFASS